MLWLSDLEIPTNIDNRHGKTLRFVCLRVVLVVLTRCVLMQCPFLPYVHSIQDLLVFFLLLWLRVEFLLKTESGYLRDAGVT